MDPKTKSLLLAPAHELQEKMASGELTSVELVEACLAQIERHNHDGLDLRAIMSTCPRKVALAQAKKLDQERQDGKIRSGLHGVPVILKDAIVTDASLGMPTTAGSWAFASLKATKNAPVVDKLLDAGAIILGKTNMTEFCGMKSNNTPMGWCAYGGQTLSAYRKRDLEDENQPTAGGSSSGTGAGIAAGFAPLGLGTETSGSTVFPASVSGLYAMVVRDRDRVPTRGVFCLSASFDGVGLMARDPRDLAALYGVLANTASSEPESVSESAHLSASLGDASVWGNLSIGVLDPSWGVGESFAAKWRSPDVKAVYEAAVEKMRFKGARVVYPLEGVPEANTLKSGDENLRTVSYHEFPGQVAEFLQNFEAESTMTGLQDVINWNERNAEKALPAPHTTQTELIAALGDTMTPETHQTAIAELRRRAGRDGLGRVMREQGLDLVASCSESNLVSFAACARWPVGTVPLGNALANGQPYGLFVLARDGEEHVLLTFMAAYFETFSPVEGPTGPFE